MEEIAKKIVITFSIVIELFSALVIAVALVRMIFRYIKAAFEKEIHISNSWVRIKFGSSLTLSLELLLAADILRTAVAPTWDDIGKLAAIAAIRTALNYFLEKELSNIEKRNIDS